MRLESRRIHGKTYSIAVPAILYGGNGNSVLDASGSSAANVLIGGAGNDTLTGGSGATILIGGTTNYDPNSTTLTPDQQLPAFDALMAEWSRTDLSGTRQQTYLERVHDLPGTTAGGLNGGFLLDAATVHDDGVRDILSGDVQGLDWFFASAAGTDRVSGKRAGDVTTGV